MTNRLPHMGVAHAIAEERQRWDVSAGQSAQAHYNASIAGQALDRLARDLAGRLHPTVQTDFLKRSGTQTE